MEAPVIEKNKKRSKKQVKKNSSAYLQQREKANARKRKFLDKMTEEEREFKRAKDREYYQKKKAEKKVKNVGEMTEREKRKQRKIWKEASKKYREKKKAISSIINNTPPNSDNESAAARHSVRRTVGRKIVRKDRAKAYRKIKQQGKTIANIKRKYETLKKRLRRKEKREQENVQEPITPNSKVDALLKNIDVPPEVRKNLLFNEVLTAQLEEKACTLRKNSKEREIFQKCVSGDLVRKYKLLHMTKTFLPKEKSASILKSDTKIREVVLTKEVCGKVKDFFERDDVSRMCPGKRDFVKRNGIKKQKRLLLFTVKEITSKFVQQTGINLSYATLLRAKPFWVVAPTFRDRESCLCVKHENFKLKLNKLKTLQQLVNHGSIEKTIEEYSCDITSYDCMNGLCGICKNPKNESPDNADSVTYFQWKSVIEEKIVKGENKKFKITKKASISSTVNELKSAFIEDIPVMKKHLYGIYSYNKLKKEMKENFTEEEVIIQIDFSENYTTKYDNEIQSTHFAKTQLSIHTGVYYTRNVDKGLKSRSFATVSENLDHQAHAVWAHMKPILQIILENKDINTIHIYSDGPTSQYRNRTNIHLWLQTLIKEFKQIIKATWTYSEPGHGKGPMDGVGGTIKRTADRHVLMGHDITTSSDLGNLFKKSTILVKEIPNDDISRAKDLVPKSLDAIPGIMNITKIIWQREPEVIIKTYRHDRFVKQLKMTVLSDCLYPNYEPGNNEIPSTKSPEPKEPMDIIDVQDLLQLKKGSIYNTIYSSSSDDEDLMSISLRQQTTQKPITIEAGTSYNQDKENLHPNLISPGTFVLVNVPTQKKTVNYRYVAICKTDVDKDDGEILVTFLNSVRNNSKKFKLDPSDVSYVAFEQIISIITTPLLKKENNIEYYYFETDIDVYEKF